jgi:hypothetical protein
MAMRSTTIGGVDSAMNGETLQQVTRDTHAWRVMRFCCRSGNCLDCGAGFNKANRKWVVHANKLTKASADRMVAGWAEFGAKAELDDFRKD